MDYSPVPLLGPKSARSVARPVPWSARFEKKPGPPFVGIDREWEIRRALEHGVRGYLLVGCALDELAVGVRAVHRGARHLSTEVAARLAESVALEPLTAREEQVLRLVAEGLCNKAIGRKLGIAVGTVKSHLKSAFDKLDVESRTQAVAAVERRGLLRQSTPTNHAGNRSQGRMPMGLMGPAAANSRSQREVLGVAGR